MLSQGIDYVRLRLYVQTLHRALCTQPEYSQTNKWYTDLFIDGPGFETYEPDEVPLMVNLEQRVRDTGNAFDNFNAQILKLGTKYTEAFTGQRPKASKVGNWLER